MQLSEELSETLKRLPNEPGVYLFKDAKGKVLYVGKAKSLRTRVRSYFSGGDGRYQIPKLISLVADVDVLATSTVKEALLLENELIKKHHPRFNVRLRDDKQYLALRLDPKEEWPRLIMVRKFRDDGADYFGPYTSSGAMREVVSNLQRVFPLRPCTNSVFKDYARRGRPCIKYEMKRCSGPCCELVPRDVYQDYVRGTQLFLRGESDALIEEMTQEMKEAAKAERFEEAAYLRDQLTAIEGMLQRQQIVAEDHVDRDVFGIARDGGEAQVQVLFVREGRLVGGSDYAFSNVDIDDGALMSSFLDQYYGDAEDRAVPREILTPVEIDDDDALVDLLADRGQGRVELRQPKRGPRREVVEMAKHNAELHLLKRVEARTSLEVAFEELRERLGLSTLPRHIECYDVSNLQGTFSVASRVVFREGHAAKGDYRKYRIREATGGDDVACLREVLQRRLGRIESEPLPDLLMVDGGKGQLGVAVAALHDAGVSLDALGLAKERDDSSASASKSQTSTRVKRGGGLKAERIFLPRRKDAVMLASNSRGLLLLQRVRDESHRFAIEYQRSLRMRIGMTSILEELPGIGPSKRRALLRELGSLRAVREASVEELEAVSGISKNDARTLHGFFEALSQPEPETQLSGTQIEEEPVEPSLEAEDFSPEEESS